jgi:hypothetical protein
MGVKGIVLDRTAIFWGDRGRGRQGARRSVSRVLSGLATGTAIPLGRALRHASRDQPGRRGGNALAAWPFGHPPVAPIRSCSRWGLPCRPRYRGCGALLPLRFTLARGELPPCAGGLFSVALSLGSPPPAVSRHRIPVEPGLSSTGVAPGSGRPTVWRRSHARAGRTRQRPVRGAAFGRTLVRCPARCVGSGQPARRVAVSPEGTLHVDRVHGGSDRAFDALEPGQVQTLGSPILDQGCRHFRFLVTIIRELKI